MPSNKVVHICAPYVEHGGAEKQMRYLVEVLADLGYAVTVHVIAPTNPDRPIPRGWDKLGVRVEFYDTDVTALRRSPLTWATLSFRIWRRTRKSPVVYMYSAYFLPLVPMLAVVGSRCIFSERILSDATRRRRPMYYLARPAACFVVNSETLVEFFTGVHANVEYVKNRVDRIRWKASGMQDEQSYSRIAIISRLDPFKNIPFALDALADESGLEINIYGEGVCTERRKIEEIARRAKCRIRLNKTTAIDEIYSGNDLIVHPSLAEGTPNVLLEAMISRKPIIASSIEENRLTGIDERLLFDAQDHTSLQTTLQYLRNVDRNELESIMDSNQRVAEQRYGSEQFRTRIESLFRRYA